MSNEILEAGAFRAPSVLLSGTVDYAMYNSFRDQLGSAPVTGLIVVVLSTLGGDPEAARMMARMGGVAILAILVMSMSAGDVPTVTTYLVAVSWSPGSLVDRLDKGGLPGPWREPRPPSMTWPSVEKCRALALYWRSLPSPHIRSRTGDIPLLMT
jgi:hypothetical protein